MQGNSKEAAQAPQHNRTMRCVACGEWLFSGEAISHMARTGHPQFCAEQSDAPSNHSFAPNLAAGAGHSPTPEGRDG
jgi:hypothetical protein